MRTLPSLLERGAGGSLSRGRTPGENGSRRGLTGSGARHAVDDAQQVRAAREGHVSLSRAPRRQRGTVLLQEVDQPPERLEALPLVARGDTRVNPALASAESQRPSASLSRSRPYFRPYFSVTP